VNLDTVIGKHLRKLNEIEAAKHESSGKLSAGQLGKPLLEQVLKLIGVKQDPFDDYTLRLFERGKQVEKWLVDIIAPDQKEQQLVEYRDCIGYVDAVIDGVPYEVKSVKGSQWKWLNKEGAKQSHKLQAGLYALAMKSGTYTIVYVCADDFRTMVCELNTADISDEIDKCIDEVDRALKARILPPFEAKEKWQENPKYSSYSEWISLSPEMAMAKLERENKQAFDKLTKGDK
jgi:hypothetical protein